MNFSPAEQAVFSLERGDVLVSEGCGSIDELGASARYSGELAGTVCFQNTLLRLRARPGIADPAFIELWARDAYATGAFARVANGTSIFHIGATRAQTMPVVLPPLAEQRRIVDLVASLDSVLVAAAPHPLAAQATELAILNATVRKTSRTMRLADLVVAAKAGATPSRSQPANYGGAVPWLKSGEVDADWIATTDETITEQGLRSCSTWLMPAGAIVVAMYGQGPTAGNVGFTAVPMACNQAVLGLVPNTDLVHPRFLFHWLWSRKRQLRARRAGSTQPNLNKALVLQEHVPVLPIDRQRVIAAALDEVRTCTRAVTVLAARCHELRSALLADLLSGNHEIPESYDRLLESA